MNPHELSIPVPQAAPPAREPFRTYRIVTDAGRVLRLGFSAPNPQFGPEPDDAAEFPDWITAQDMATRIYDRMAKRYSVMGMQPPTGLKVVEQVWDDKGFAWWEAMQRFDRTAIETHRSKASVLPAAFRKEVAR